MADKAPALTPIEGEFTGADLGDKRRTARLLTIATRAALSPEKSFPKLVSSEAEREALYRFFSNDAVEWEDILEPHFVATVARAENETLTRVVHDTTDFVFTGDREGLEPVFQNTKGFIGHFAMAVSGDENRIPLGVIGMLPYVRHKAEIQPLNQRKLEVRTRPRVLKESNRWGKVAKGVAARFSSMKDVVHVMDQEADDFALFAELNSAEIKFVIRSSASRLLRPRGDSVGSQLEAQESQAFRSVPLSKRDPNRSAKARKSHPPRIEREARLELRWVEVVVQKPQHAQSDHSSITLRAVQVFEPDPPDGEAAVSWTLLTNLPVGDAAAATEIVDHYRARWRIEEYFRALKQGCAIQQRQLETFPALLNAIAVFVPVAWRLLLIRSLARLDVTLPAAMIFDDNELGGIGALLDDKNCKPLPALPTVRDVMLAIATIGGHIKNNGEPGWIVLGRGYEDVCTAASVWRAAMKRAKM